MCSDEEREREQRGVAVQGVHDEPRPARRAAQRCTSATPSATASVSSSSATAPVERVRYQSSAGPAAARGERRVVIGDRPREWVLRQARARGASCPATEVDAPSSAPRASRRWRAPRRRARPGARAGRAAAASRGARSPRTSAAVPRCSRRRRSPAATLTVRQGPRTGAPAAGSMMWCIVTPSWRQRRTAVEEVARPPEAIEIVCPGASGPSRWSSVTWISQPSAGAAPAVAMSPPRLDQHPAAARRRGRRARRGRRPTLWRSRRGRA